MRIPCSLGFYATPCHTLPQPPPPTPLLLPAQSSGKRRGYVRYPDPMKFLLLCFLLAGCVLASAKQLIVIIETTKGDIEVELYPNLAPETVRNFLRYVDEGRYA